MEHRHRKSSNMSGTRARVGCVMITGPVKLRPAATTAPSLHTNRQLQLRRGAPGHLREHWKSTDMVKVEVCDAHEVNVACSTKIRESTCVAVRGGAARGTLSNRQRQRMGWGAHAREAHMHAAVKHHGPTAERDKNARPSDILASAKRKHFHDGGKLATGVHTHTQRQCRRGCY